MRVSEGTLPLEVKPVIILYDATLSGLDTQVTLRAFSPLLKNTCVRQVVLDKWFPLTKKEALSGGTRK